MPGVKPPASRRNRRWRQEENLWKTSGFHGVSRVFTGAGDDMADGAIAVGVELELPPIRLVAEVRLGPAGLTRIEELDLRINRQVFL